jgi:hypothetical protein
VQLSQRTLTGSLLKHLSKLQVCTSYFCPCANVIHVFADDHDNKHCSQSWVTNHGFVIIRWMRSQQSAQTPPFCLATLPAISMKRWAYLCAFAMSQPCLDGRMPSLLQEEFDNTLDFCLLADKKKSVDQCIYCSSFARWICPCQRSRYNIPLNLWWSLLSKEYSNDSW